jgi:microcin C transport system substrate-binding protein
MQEKFFSPSSSASAPRGNDALLTRRKLLVLSAGAVASAKAGGFAASASANEKAESHGISAFGDLKYPANFSHFEYANPDAPKGGVFSQIGPSRQLNQNFLTFNSLNGFILKGEAAQGIERTFVTLMERAWDEPDAMYGLAARSVRITDHGRTYRFALRPEARFHDDSKLTAHDVAFTMLLLKEKGHPILQQILRDLDAAEAADDATLVLRFSEKRARDVPLLVAGLPIFSKAYYSKKAFDESTLEPPLGSGAYKVASSSRAASSNTTASRTGGARSFRSTAAATTSTSCATSITATVRSRSKASPRRAICSARSSPRAHGPAATTSRRSGTAA